MKIYYVHEPSAKPKLGFTAILQVYISKVKVWIRVRALSFSMEERRLKLPF